MSSFIDEKVKEFELRLDDDNPNVGTTLYITREYNGVLAMSEYDEPCYTPDKNKIKDFLEQSLTEYEQRVEAMIRNKARLFRNSTSSPDKMLGATALEDELIKYLESL